jgi:hypothetical protein
LAVFCTRGGDAPKIASQNYAALFAKRFKNNFNPKKFSSPPPKNKRVFIGSTKKGGGFCRFPAFSARLRTFAAQFFSA